MPTDISRLEDREQAYPITSYSWKALSEMIAVKKMDKSSFHHRGTGIPLALRPFFGLENFAAGEKRRIIINHKNEKYAGHFIMTRRRMQTLLFWKSEFADVLKVTFPEWFKAFLKDSKLPTDLPVMRFKKLRDDFSAYQIDLINPSELDLDIESEIFEEQGPRSEGSVKYCYGKRYERDPNNRRRAIELHGVYCVICGFDFEEKYGVRGRDYIEIHHTEPLSSSDQEQIVNPKTDLVPVCSNCHRMIHRRRDLVLSVEEMKRITKSHEELRSRNHM